jgi:SAM-dependent methyltransferase
VFRYRDRILRLVQGDARQDTLNLLDSDTYRRLVADGLIVASRVLSPEEARGIDDQDLTPPDGHSLLLEHPAVAFPTYPYEWCPEMLLAAGRLTLTLAEELLRAGLGLKDASPYNVLFDGARPVFVDVLSIERRAPGDATWLPYAQFQRNFVLPLLANRHFGLTLAQTFLGRRDGLEPESAYRLLKGHWRFRPPFLGAVTLPTWLGRGEKASQSPRTRSGGDAEQSQYIVRSLLRYLGRQLEQAGKGPPRRSHWSDYAEANSYSAESAAAKGAFVAAALRASGVGRVLDIGCNTGRFARMAGESGASVVAMDADEVVVGRVFRDVGGMQILPMVADVSRPSPALGWRNEEQLSLLERASGQFDLVLALAVLHHLIATDGIPVEEVLALVAALTRRHAVVEFVAPSDPMFRRIARGRDHLHAALTREEFERCCRRHFAVEAHTGPLGGTRWLYLLRKV